MLLLALFTILIALCLAGTRYAYRMCFYSSSHRVENPYEKMNGEQYDLVEDNIMRCTAIMERSSCEDVFITSFDGIKLHGRYYHLYDGAPVQIMFHGYRSMALRDCTGGYMLATKMGFNVLAVDQRAHGKSEGNTIAFGVLERQDCLSWVKYAKEHFSERAPIVLSGLSMGAATVLMASDLPLVGVVAIMADCPYCSPAEIIRKVCRDRGLPDKIVYPFVRLGARIFGGFSLEQSSAIKSVAQTNIPILLIHGDDDRFVPCYMSEKIYAACNGPAQLHTFPDAGHGLSYMVDPLRYEAVTVGFLWSIPALRPYLEQNDYVQKELSGQNIP